MRSSRSLRLRDVPWSVVADLHRAVRLSMFTQDRPTGPYLVVDHMPADVERALGRQSFAPNWEFSFNYRGEALNLAKVLYENPAPPLGPTWWQTHVRGWTDPERGNTELMAHWEPEPTEDGNAHLEGVGFDRERGTRELAEALDAAGMDYVRGEWTRGDG